ncbi:MAG: cation transporter [Natronospirillum sp.]
MGHSCGTDAAFDGNSKAYRTALWWVIAINGVMFLVEIAAGALSGSRALLADSLDFFSDTATYTLSLLVLGYPLRVRAMAAMVKGISLVFMGVGVLGFTVWQVFAQGVPEAHIMGWVGLAALLANVASVFILLRYRSGDSNVRSVWLCSRNDAIGNVAVIFAAILVAYTGRAWPDLVVAALMASLFLRSAFLILKQAMSELRH